MTRNPSYLFIACATLAAAGCGATPEETVTPKTATPTAKPTVQHGRLPINGVTYYYEVHGEGEPLLLLHGGLGSIEMFGPVLPALAEHRQVIAVDLHGHGRTPLGERPVMDLPAQGDDLAVLIAHLGHDQVDVMGYSLGAGVAFRLAAQHPDKVRRLVLASGAFSREGYYPELLPLQSQVSGAIAEQMKETPMYKSYAAIAPDPAEFPRLLDAIGDLMREDHDWSADVAKLTMPTMLIYGDSDMFRLEHVVEFYHLLGGGLRDAGWMREHMSQNRLAILPNVTHYEMFMAPALPATALPFLDGKTGAPSWDAQVDQQLE